MVGLAFDLKPAASQQSLKNRSNFHEKYSYEKYARTSYISYIHVYNFDGYMLHCCTRKFHRHIKIQWNSAVEAALTDCIDRNTFRFRVPQRYLGVVVIDFVFAHLGANDFDDQTSANPVLQLSILGLFYFLFHWMMYWWKVSPITMSPQQLYLESSRATS